MPQNLFQVPDVGFGGEDVLKLIKEPGTIKLDRAEDFEGIALTHGWDFRLTSYSGPGLVECRVLSEAGLVPKKDGRPLAFGFFLISGN